MDQKSLFMSPQHSTSSYSPESYMNIVMQREAPREIKNLLRTASFRTLNSLAWPDPWMHGP